MEVIKCGLCKEEIEYAQHCRVYIKTNEPRPYQRISKRPHLGRFKLISIAKSTEHISFARRLKLVREKRININSSNNSANLLQVDQNTKPSLETKGNTKEFTSTEKSELEKKPDIEPNHKGLKRKESESSGKTEENISESKPFNQNITKDSESSKESQSFYEDLKPLKKPAAIQETTELVVNKRKLSKKTTCSFKKLVVGKSKKKTQNIRKLLPRKNSNRKKMSHPHFQSSFEEYIKPSLSKNSSTPNANKETTRKNSDLNNEFDQHKKLQVAGNSKSVKNGSINNSNNSDCETYYWLELPKPKQPELRKLGYDFENLVTEVKHMKLPNSDWKIKIMVHKQEMVSVSFTKKLFPEKIISVNAKSSVCDILMDGKKIILLGSPIYIHSIKDLEIMLDIVNDIELDSPMITYLKTVT